MGQTIPAYVINLDRRPDRWAIISENLHRIGVRVERIAAVDARLLGQQERRVDVGALACAWSHRKAMQAFLDTDAPAALILEDDAELADDTASLLASTEWWPPNMRAVRLECCYPVGRKWVSSAPVWPAEARTATGRTVHRFERFAGGTCAYIITRAAAEIVAPTLVVPDNEVDQMLWNKRRSKLARKLRPHQIVPAMARQRDAGTDLGADRDAALVALGKAGRRRLRRRGLLHMARVRLLMALGLVRRVTVEYAPSL